MGRGKKTRPSISSSGVKKAIGKADPQERRDSNGRAKSPVPRSALGGAAGSSSSSVVQTAPTGGPPTTKETVKVNVYAASGEPLSIVVSVTPAAPRTEVDNEQSAVKVEEVMRQIAAARKGSRWTQVVVYDTDADQMIVQGDGEEEGSPFFPISATIPIEDLVGDAPKRTLGFYVVDAGVVNPHFPGGNFVKSRLVFDGEVIYPLGDLCTRPACTASYAAVDMFLRSAEHSAKPTPLDLAYVGTEPGPGGSGPEDSPGRNVHYASINDLAVRQSRGFALRSLTLNTQNTPYKARSMLSDEEAGTLFCDWGTSNCTIEKLHLHGPLPPALLEQLAKNIPPTLQELEISWLSGIGPGVKNWSARELCIEDMEAMLNIHSKPVIYRPQFVKFLTAFAKLVSMLPASIKKVAHVSIDDDGNTSKEVSGDIDGWPEAATRTAALERVANSFRKLENLEVLDLDLGTGLTKTIAAKMSNDAHYLPSLKTCGSIEIANARPGVELKTSNFWSVKL